MFGTLSSYSVAFKGKLFGLFGHPTLMLGENPSGDPVTLKTDASGQLLTGGASSASTTALTGGQAYKTVASSGTAEAITGVATLVETVEFQARKNRTTANSGNVFLGFAAGSSLQYRVLEPGETWSLVAPAGKRIDLNAIFIDAATTGDGVCYSSLK